MSLIAYSYLNRILPVNLVAIVQLGQNEVPDSVKWNLAQTFGLWLAERTAVRTSEAEGL